MKPNPINDIKGFGDKKISLINKMGLYTVNDVLYDFPYRYIDRRHVRLISEIQNGEQAVISCHVVKIKTKYIPSKKMNMVILDVVDSFFQGEIVFFSKYAIKAFKENEAYYFYGKIEKKNNRFKMNHPEFAPIALNSFLKISPIYNLTQGITQKDMLKLHEGALDRVNGSLDETLPNSLLSLSRVCSRQIAFDNIHFPKDEHLLKVAKYRLIYEELLMLQLKLILLKNNYHKPSAPRMGKSNKERIFINKLPFHLTKAQLETVDAIDLDMDSGYTMNRLIQGDVGSGKTIVAFIALYKCVIAGFQGALMVPTTVLAEQHFKSMCDYFANDLTIKLLTSNMTSKEKMQVKLLLSEGKIDVLIATHAVLEEDVVFASLGLVVTDEQHRFGVRQRLIVSLKGVSPHILIMSATPIPRTLSLILYGDMDISVMNELPMGRKEIKTHFVGKSKLEEMYQFIYSEVSKGRQAYFVCPLVEDSEQLDLVSATTLFETLTHRYSDLNIGIIHGKMKGAEKEAVMKDFTVGNIQILVSTTVIEVGINVPNATVMVIVNAERFGLSQLHQLRGRVGRGQEQSFCFLLSDKLSKEGKMRVETLVNSNDGFVIADKDLQMRGPGEIFGLKQHGLPELKLANLIKHQNILKTVQEHVKMILSEYQLGNREFELFVNRIKNEIKDEFTL